MTRVVSTVLVLLLAISMSACAKLSTKNQERYYVGMGASLDQIDQNIKAFGVSRNNQDLVMFNNESGKFNGAVVVRQMLQNGPARKAGLEDGDIILTIDGEDASMLGVSGVVNKITSKSIGDGVDLKVRRTDKNGIVLNEFDTNIVLERIDRVSWIPLDRELRGAFCTGNECVEYTTKVSEDKTTERFNYYFKFTNTHLQPIILRSVLFDLLTGNDFFKLEPMSSEDLVLNSGSFPVMDVPAPIREFISANDNPDTFKYFQENYPDTNSEKYYYKDPDGNLWLHTLGTSGYFFVPIIWRDMLVEEDKKF